MILGDWVPSLPTPWLLSHGQVVQADGAVGLSLQTWSLCTMHRASGCALQCSPHTCITFLPPSVRHPLCSKKEAWTTNGNACKSSTKEVKYALGKWGADYLNSQEKKKKTKNKKSVLSADVQVLQKEPFLGKQSRHSFLTSAIYELKDLLQRVLIKKILNS